MKYSNAFKFNVSAIILMSIMTISCTSKPVVTDKKPETTLSETSATDLIKIDKTIDRLQGQLLELESLKEKADQKNSDDKTNFAELLLKKEAQVGSIDEIKQDISFLEDLKKDIKK